MNNRLDFITKFKDHDTAVDEMTRLRKLFIELDEVLRLDAELNQGNHALLRSIANARTKIEEGCQHAIKALCLKHEDKSQ